MYNKVLADLIRERLNNELEKIKLELFEDDNYAPDIEDSIDVVKRQISQDNELNQTETKPVQVQSIKPEIKEVSHDQSPVVQEVDFTKNEQHEYVPTQYEQNDNITQDSVQPVPTTETKDNKYDMKKIIATIAVILVLLASAYFFL